MATCALAASANGKVSLFQRMKVDRILETEKRLAKFDPHEGMHLFNAYSVRLQADTEVAHRQLYEIIKSAIDNEETANSLIEMSQAMIQQCPQASKARIEMTTLCKLLGSKDLITSGL